MTPAEALRHQIRQALGAFNDPRRDVVALVAELVMEVLMRRDEVEALKLDLAFKDTDVVP